MRVVEIDMCFTFLMYFICIFTVSFHEFTAICGICVVVLTFLMTIAHILPENTEGQKTGKRFFKFICKVGNVALTVLAFFQIFISDMSFDIKGDIEAWVGYTLLNAESYIPGTPVAPVEAIAGSG